MKKILFVISNMNIGGPQKSLIALLDLLDYSLFEVDVLLLYPNGVLKNYINKEARIIEAPDLVSAFTLPSVKISKWIRIIAKSCGLSVALNAIKELLKGRLVYDNVSVSRQRFWKRNHKFIKKMDGEYDAAFGILGLSSYYLIDCVTAAHKYHWIRSDVRVLKHDREIDAEYFEKCTGFLSVSHDCASIFEETYPFSSGRIKTFYNYIPETFYSKMSVDTSLIENNCAKTKILTICRLDPLKGLDMAIEACSILKQRGYDVCWFVLGDGKYRKNVEKMIKDIDIEDCFILLGFSYNTLEFIRNADIVVHPSRTEGKSNAVDEALFSCKPTIVTNYVTATEVITNGVNGVICQMSGKSIADSIERIILDGSFRMSLIQGCHGKKTGDDANEVLLQLC